MVSERYIIGYKSCGSSIFNFEVMLVMGSSDFYSK